MGFKNSIINFFCGALLFLLFLVGLNVGIDVDHAFRRNREQRVADWLHKNHHVANVHRTNERLINKLLIEKGKTYNTIVLGSSRGLQINRSMFNHTDVYNFSHKGASLQDFYGYTHLLQEQQGLPQQVVLVIDPWMFKSQGKYFLGPLSESYWIFSHQLSVKAKPLGFQSAPTTSFSQLLSLDYLSDNLISLLNQDFPWMYPTSATDLSDPVKHTDGSLSYPAAVRQASIKEIFAKAERMAYGPSIAILKNFKELDKGQKDHFNSLMQYYQSRNIEVMLYLPPFNPIVWGTIQNDPSYKAVLQTEAYLRKFTMEQGILLLGSYDPHQMYLNPEDFYDGLNLSRQATHRFFQYGVAPKKAEAIQS